MANISFDSQTLFTPSMMIGPKPTSRRPINGLSECSAIIISSDEESDYEDLGYLSSTSNKPVPSLDELSRQPAKHKDAQSGSVASIGKGGNAASSAGGDCGAVGPSASRDPESRDAIALGQEPQALGIKSSAAPSPPPTRPGPLSVPPVPAQSDQDAAGRAINHNGPRTTEEASISEIAACNEAADGLCRKSWTRDGARHLCSSAHHCGPCSPRFEGDTSRQSTPRRNSADEGQNKSEGAGSGAANNKEGDTWPPRQRCETPLTDNGLDAAPHCDKELPSQQQKTGRPARSTLALSSRSSAPVILREEDQPVAAGSASSEVRQASDPEDATYGNFAYEVPRAPLPQGQPRRAPNLRRRSGPQPRDSKHQDTTTHHDSATESNSHDGVDPPRTDLESGQKKASDLRGRRRPRGTFKAEADGAKAAEDEDMYCPEGSEGQQDEEDSDGDFRPPPRKRHKMGPPSQSTLRRTATRRQVRSDSVVSEPRQARTSIRGQRSSGGLGMVRRSSPRRCGGEERTVQASRAEFQEWPLQDAILKRVIVDGLATFQLQFRWPSCAGHQREESMSESQQCKPLPKQTGDPRAEVDREEEWEVQEVLHSRTHYRKLQYMVKWVSGDDDKEWYNADGFKGSPHLLQKYHADHPERPGPPVRLEEWLRAYEDGVEAPEHPDDNKPARAASTEST